MSREKRAEKHMAPEPKRRKRGLWWKIPVWIIIIAVILAGSAMLVNYGVSLHLRHYISSFDPVDYGDMDRVVPEIDPETGYYTFTTDRDLRIMMLTDIHMAAKDVISIFNHEGVYFSTVFGNHDTEVFGYTGRQKLGELYMNKRFEYCIFDQNFTDGAELPTVTNQIIQVKNTKGELTKALLLIDSNAYVDDSIQAVLDWNYDIIRDSTVDWAAESIKALGSPKTVAFFHIPTSEFRIAYEDLEAHGWKDTEDTKYISGVWDELVDATTHSRIWHGGITKEGPLADIDKFFETLGPDGMNVLEACYCGHDHVNNAMVNYKGVDLCYGYSMDNLAYADINYSGAQRGATIITITPEGKRITDYNNAYRDYGVPSDEFVEVYTDHLLYEGGKPDGVLMP